MNSIVKCIMEETVCSMLDDPDLIKPRGGAFPCVLGSGMLDFVSQVDSTRKMQAPYLVMTLCSGTPLVKCFPRYVVSMIFHQSIHSLKSPFHFFVLQFLPILLLHFNILIFDAVE